MTLLWLVRHGRPRVDPALPPSEWPLAPDAAPDITRLRTRLPEEATWVSSPEPKALSTARLLTDEPVDVVDDLREAVRPAVWYGAGHWEALVRRSVLDPDVAADQGWEPATSAQSRVVAALRSLLARQPERLVLVGHGMAWTLLVAALTGSRPDLDGWSAMRMPDVAMLETTEAGSARLVRGWGMDSC